MQPRGKVTVLKCVGGGVSELVQPSSRAIPPWNGTLHANISMQVENLQIRQEIFCKDSMEKPA